MDLAIINNWNAKVSNDDTIYCLGDFALKSRVKFYADRLNGNKILILGNHDRESQCAGHFKEIHTSLELSIGGKNVLLSHYPYVDAYDLQYDHKFRDRMLVPAVKDRQWLLHGHQHNHGPKINLEKRMINLGVEHWGFSPVPEIEIERIINA
jgi:calcineurin-like phosphoesterase family protein